QAGRRVVAGREVRLLVVAASVAPLVHRHPEQPARAPHVVQGDHRGVAARLAQQIEQGVHEVVGLYRTPGDVHDGDACSRYETISQVVGEAHAARGVALDGVNAAVRRAG